MCQLTEVNKAMIDHIYTAQDKQPYITEFKASVVLECHTVLRNASYIQDNHFSSVLAEILHLKETKKLSD